MNSISTNYSQKTTEEQNSLLDKNTQIGRIKIVVVFMIFWGIFSFLFYKFLPSIDFSEKRYLAGYMLFSLWINLCIFVLLEEIQEIKNIKIMIIFMTCWAILFFVLFVVLKFLSSSFYNTKNSLAPCLFYSLLITFCIFSSIFEKTRTENSFNSLFGIMFGLFTIVFSIYIFRFSQPYQQKKL